MYPVNVLVLRGTIQIIMIIDAVTAVTSNCCVDTKSTSAMTTDVRRRLRSLVCLSQEWRARIVNMSLRRLNSKLFLNVDFQA